VLTPAFLQVHLHLPEGIVNAVSSVCPSFLLQGLSLKVCIVELHLILLRDFRFDKNVTKMRGTPQEGLCFWVELACYLWGEKISKKSFLTL
jgi:hypothetical protein